LAAAGGNIDAKGKPERKEEKKKRKKYKKKREVP